MFSAHELTFVYIFLNLNNEFFIKKIIIA